MDQQRSLRCSVGEFLALVNQTLDFAYPNIEIEGEVSSFKVNQNKFVFFDLKDEEGTVGCFMTVWQLRMPIEDGMKIVVQAAPKITQWGKFSVTVKALRPVGHGAIKKSAELLKKKLDDEGLFRADKKRIIPRPPRRIGVISSTQAAGYADFIRILDQRWRGIDIDVAHVQVQGVGAAQQIIAALTTLNERADQYDAVVIIRGGGSADDLATFNDEPLVRAVAASRVPVMTGIGHDTDTSLVDLAADVMATTPSNAAERLVPDRHDVIATMQRNVHQNGQRLTRRIDTVLQQVHEKIREVPAKLVVSISNYERRLASIQTVINAHNPEKILRRGYAILHGTIRVGERLMIDTATLEIQTEVKHVDQK